MIKSFWSILIVAIFTINSFGLSIPEIIAPEGEILKTLKQDHPRLIIQEKDIPRIRQLIKDDKTAKAIYDNIKKEADKILNQETVEYKIVGPRLLTQSRRCLDKVYTLSLVYLIENDQKYLKRAVIELRAAANFPDWNPSHFLDTAEMTHAFAIGYDWLYAGLNQEEKTFIRSAIIDKGLQVYLDRLADKDTHKSWYVRCQHNWNQVCNGGIGTGALAIADEAPELAEKVLSICINHMPLALQHYAPDGGWNEGPGYWHYASRYTVYFLAALQTALNNDFGLSDYPGLDNAGQFRMHFEGPTGASFNYADAGSRVRGTHEMYWMAQRYTRPEYAWFQRQDASSAHPLDLIWYSAEGGDPVTAGLPLDIHYKGIDVVFLRSSWTDPNAIFVGFKGGDNKANHSHLDLGSFVFDALGERWATDLGSDNYNMPGYFGDNRWTYYRLINESHNTLVIDGANQNPKAAAPIISMKTTNNGAFAIADLSEAYGVKRAHRGIMRNADESILVQDEIESDKSVEVKWGMMTGADIKLSGNTATLSIGEKHLQAQIISPENVRFDIESAQPPKPQKQNEGMKKLIIRTPDKVKSLTLTVLLTPYENDQKPDNFKRNCTVLEKW